MVAADKQWIGEKTSASLGRPGKVRTERESTEEVFREMILNLTVVVLLDIVVTCSSVSFHYRPKLCFHKHVLRILSTGEGRACVAMGTCMAGGMGGREGTVEGV